ncbi:MAG: shikimate kinase [Bacteroidales bacterium]|nr:shikimate kinase [Bacteroidales bacterium]
MNIYLIGFMGSGKSTAGRKIAAALHWHFLDLDNVAVDQQGLTIPEMFSLHGESFFRDAEAKALHDISSRSKTVVACGGGTPCSETNMELMKRTGIVVYLKMTAPALVSRLVASKNKRPLLEEAGEGGISAKVESLLKVRTPWYEQADIITDGLNIDTGEITELLAARIRDAGAFL